MDVKQITKTLIRKISIYKKEYFNKHRRVCFSQEGEDLILFELLPSALSGFYVDVGAHDPRRFSNTYLLYLKGWRGINIDPLPNSMIKFKRLRPRDINLEVGVSRKKQYLTYYSYEEPALNSFQIQTDNSIPKADREDLIDTRKILTLPLSEILDEYVPKAKTIDLLSVDVEGMDLEVLQSNNWERYTPKMILVESAVRDLSVVHKDPTFRYLTKLGYTLIAKTSRTCFYQLNRKEI